MGMASRVAQRGHYRAGHLTCAKSKCRVSWTVRDIWCEPRTESAASQDSFSGSPCERESQRRQRNFLQQFQACPAQRRQISFEPAMPGWPRRQPRGNVGCSQSNMLTMQQNTSNADARLGRFRATELTKGGERHERGPPALCGPCAHTQVCDVPTLKRDVVCLLPGNRGFSCCASGLRRGAIRLRVMRGWSHLSSL